MARKYSRPWWVNCRWEVQGTTRTGERKAFYCSATRSGAKANFEHFRQIYGEEALRRVQFRIVPGPGHKTKRGF